MEETGTEAPDARRRERCDRLGARLEAMDDARLRALVEESAPPGPWRTHVLELEGSRVLVKRLPVTALEHRNPLATANLYGLPPGYHYGVGSAGFGVFRELAAHLRTTAWVLGGQAGGFPLLYHHRVLPFLGERGEPDPERRRRYVEYWGGDEAIARYMRDRDEAGHVLLLFMEHLPHELGPWLREHPGHLHRVAEDLRATVLFLRERGMIHFDLHLGNLLADGERAYLVDFGLVADRDFDLDPAERAFFDDHTEYDLGSVLLCLSVSFYHRYLALPEEARQRLRERHGLAENAPPYPLLRTLLERMEEIREEGLMEVDEDGLAFVVRYRGVALLMHDFLLALRRDRRKATRLPHARLRQLLVETGFVPDGAWTEEG